MISEKHLTFQIMTDLEFKDYDNYGNFDFFQNNQNLKNWIYFGNDFFR